MISGGCVNKLREMNSEKILKIIVYCIFLGQLKNILLMTSVDPILGLTRDNKKPAIVNYYNYTMGGTDVVDQLMSHKVSYI